MVYSLENDKISVKIKEIGAELCSYFDKKSNREVVWQANPDYWKRHAPILFPIVGKVENNEYKIGDLKYSLSQHGFARDQVFKVKKQNKDSITLQISSNDELFKIYPFNFKLEVEFILKEKELKVLYRVLNISDESIYFSLGAHPGFNVPFNDSSKLSDYKLSFEVTELSDRLLLSSAGFRTGKRHKNWLQSDYINLTEDLFINDALIFDNLKSSFLTIKSQNSKEQVRVGWGNYPHMGIWKPYNKATFICIEPWNGMADQEKLKGDFKSKFGIVKLPLHKTFECFYTIENILI